jgi:hypothetical protein
MSPLKRKSNVRHSPQNPKKPKVVALEYHATPSRLDEAGEAVWPARALQIDRAREIIKEWYVVQFYLNNQIFVHQLIGPSAQAKKSTVILPDKDADGLSSGAILQHTLTSLGLPLSLISVYFPPKGTSIHDKTARIAVSSKSPHYIFVLDQGSRKSAALVDSRHICLVIDHHDTEEGGFPENAEYVTAHDCPPVATTSLLTYHICLPLYLDLAERIQWLAALGTHGDLGGTVKWKPPFPDMTATFKQHTKKAINDAVALVNAPRRSAAYNVEEAWQAVISASSPASIKTNQKLEDASFEVRRETERCTHTPPKFSADGTLAVLTISSAAQIHPIIATRWSSHLRSNTLEVVLCANEGYLTDKVHFSCRVARVARAREGDNKVNIIKKLKDIVAGNEHEDLRLRLGENFARGHKEASGGIVGKKEWEELKDLMGVGGTTKKAERVNNGKKLPQKNTLANYFVKEAK